MMITFYNYFVKCGEKATVQDVAEHIYHIKNLIGVDHVGVGGDFDGINKCVYDFLIKCVLTSDKLAVAHIRGSSLLKKNVLGQVYFLSANKVHDKFEKEMFGIKDMLLQELSQLKVER